MIAINDQSIANIGRWPWCHGVHAKIIEKLSVVLAKIIANTIYFLEPQIDLSLGYPKKTFSFIASSLIHTLHKPCLL
jgi:serine/threonine-protein kinase